MKKLIVFVFLLCCLSGTAFFKVGANPLFKLKNVEEVCFVSESEFVYADVESVACGDKFFNFCSIQTAKENLEKFEKNSDAVQFYFSEITVEEILQKLKADTVESYSSNEIEITLGYTPYVQDCVLVDGKKVNVQIASTENGVIAGFPMILTGF